MHYTAIYRTANSIDNFRIKVKLKEVRSVTGLSYKSEILNVEENAAIKTVTENGGQSFECTLKWNEKVFSQTEITRYTDISKCKTDREKQYNERIKNATPNVIFTYVHDDNYVAKRDTHVIDTDTIEASFLREQMEKLQVNSEKMDNNTETINYLNKFPITNPLSKRRPEVMYIVADFHEDEPGAERVLCKLTWDDATHTLTLYPDFSIAAETKAYVIGLNSKMYHYWLENVSNEPSDELMAKKLGILHKVNQRQSSIQNDLLEFDLPAVNEMLVCVYGEIATLDGFGYDNLYVRYFVESSAIWEQVNNDDGFGVTHCARVKTKNNVAFMGFPIQFTLKCTRWNKKNGVLDLPHVYFEVISCDSWSRYRTEGFAHVTLPIHVPGAHAFKLNCFIVRTNDWTEEMRRYFIGGTNILNDFSWLANCGLNGPNKNNVLNKYGVTTQTTGRLCVNLNIICQSHMFDSTRQGADARALDRRGADSAQTQNVNALSLIQTVEHVLVAFKKARENMLQAKAKLLLE